MEAKDIILDEDYDIAVSSDGDFKVGLSDQQSADLIFNTNQGAWKSSPLVGIGIVKYRGATGKSLELKRIISMQLQMDGYKVNSVIVKDDEYYINAKRKNL